MKDKNKYGYYKCHCCGYYTLSEGEEGSYEICIVCFWEDDLFQANDPNSQSGANKISLNKAKVNFKLLGASEKEWLPHVRKPNKYEM